MSKEFDESEILKGLDDAITGNSARRDNALLTLSSAAIGLGIAYQEKFNSHPGCFKFGIVCFVICITLILISFYLTNKILHIQAKGFITKSEIKKQTALDKTDSYHTLNEVSNVLAFLSFFCGIVGLVAGFF